MSRQKNSHVSSNWSRGNIKCFVFVYNRRTVDIQSIICTYHARPNQGGILSSAPWSSHSLSYRRSGAEKAGLQKDDIINAIDGNAIALPQDFAKIKLKAGDTAMVTVIRDGKTLQIPVVTTPSTDDPQKGMLGILRAALPSYEPVVPYYIHWSPEVFMFLLWLWMLSFFIGIFNMLPLPILDGGKFIHTIIEKKVSEKILKASMISIYAVTFALFGLNIALSAVKSGFITI